MDGHMTYFLSDADARYAFQGVFLYDQHEAEYNAVTCAATRSARTKRRGTVGWIPADNSLTGWA